MQKQVDTKNNCIEQRQTIMSKTRVDRSKHHLYWNDACLHWKNKRKFIFIHMYRTSI